MITPVKHTVTDELLRNKDNLVIGGKKTTLDEIRKLAPITTEEPFVAFIQWDDMCQYTAIGLFYLINEAFDNEFKFNLLDFFNREEYPNGIEYIKKEVLKELDENDINTVYRENYLEILEKSPLTNFYNNLSMFYKPFKKIIFNFPFELPELHNLVDDISKNLFFGKIEAKASFIPNKDLHNVYKSNLHDYYVIPDMGDAYATFIDNSIAEKSILSYINHNGLNPFIGAIYADNKAKFEINGPFNINLNYLLEIKEVKNEDRSDKRG